ncbi:LysR family transcriptional regulator [Variovorax ginsengisoli]|uniref:DNA-binding transcriptional LysR family regulator n=1 Tax=Variovorax ginsengisoli TaxID=363844 RepID=A0ABT9SAH4_9BURK|nr:LysR family transcriptional regulator [Variovorax ginsengisoli]MDP9901364.1 DNA-binding transcriptional LysR family regulator [Variovorax ginsengisoli]
MDGLDLIKTFRAVAERRSFSRAALAMGVSKATASKHVAELEARCGVRLLNRSTRALSLTDAGQVLLERSTQLVESAERTLAELQEFGGTPRGRLRMTAPSGLANEWLTGVVSDFMAQYPEVSISIDFTNRDVDLVEEGIDIALQGGRIPDLNAIVRRLAPVRLVLCASPAYWARRGLPKVPEDLQRHEFLRFSLMAAHHIELQRDGQPYLVPMQSRMDCNEPAALIELALRGAGMIVAPVFLAKPHLERGALVPVFEDWMPTDVWIYAAYSQRRYNSAALRLMLDFLVRSMDAVAL